MGLDGIINVYKPEGMTSYGVIREVKKIIGEKKIGHIGTLDPLAEGVLPLFLGKMTKLIPFFNVEDKTYQATLCLGATSTTLDREGEITSIPIPENVNQNSILEAIQSFIGEIEQVPPMYSAIKLNGVALYKHARQGVTVERKSRKINIHQITNIKCNFPEVCFTVHCSKGTYIRVLAEDIGKKLNTGAYLTKLVRLNCGTHFSSECAFKLDQIRNFHKTGAFEFLVLPQNILPDFHKVEVESEDLRQRIQQGASIQATVEQVVLSKAGQNRSLAMAVMDNRLIAIGDLEYGGDSSLEFHPSKVLI